MNLFFLASGLTFAVLMQVSATTKEPSDARTIPLDQIWGYNLPGTREMRADMQGTPLKYASDEGPLLDEIRRSLPHLRVNKPQQPKRCFAVIGTGMEALREAHAVLVGKKKPQESFPASSEISAVFFSHTFSRYVQLQKVESRSNTITIQYRFVPHMTANVSEHFALIPLSKLPLGKIDVKIVRLPMEQKFVDQGVPDVGPEWNRRVVCSSFSFSIVDDSSGL